MVSFSSVDVIESGQVCGRVSWASRHLPGAAVPGPPVLASGGRQRAGHADFYYRTTKKS
jgi:hypothetical protein